MHNEKSVLHPHSILQLAEDHKRLYDQVYDSFLLPNSTADGFDYALSHRYRPQSKITVTFAKSKKLMMVDLLDQDARRIINISEERLRYDFDKISLQQFADCLHSVEIKVGKGVFSKYRNVINDSFSFKDIDNSVAGRYFLGLLIDMRYAASKAPIFLPST